MIKVNVPIWGSLHANIEDISETAKAVLDVENLVNGGDTKVSGLHRLHLGMGSDREALLFVLDRLGIGYVVQDREVIVGSVNFDPAGRKL